MRSNFRSRPLPSVTLLTVYGVSRSSTMTLVGITVFAVITVVPEIDFVLGPTFRLDVVRLHIVNRLLDISAARQSRSGERRDRVVPNAKSKEDKDRKDK